MTLTILISGCMALLVFRFIARDSRNLPRGELPSRRTLVTYGMNLWLIGLLAALVWYRGEFGILKLYVQDDQIAMYSAAVSLSGAIMQATSLLTGALVPHLAIHWRSGDRERVAMILRRVTQATLMCAVSIATILVGCGKTIILLLFGAAYVESYHVLCILAVAAISISSGCATTALQIETDARFDRNANVIGLVLLMIVSVILTPYLGIIGAGVGRAVAQITIGLYIFWRLARVDGLDTSARSFMNAFVFSISAVSLYFFVVETYDLNLFQSVAITLIYVTALLVAIRFIIGEPLALYSMITRFYQK